MWNVDRGLATDQEGVAAGSTQRWCTLRRPVRDEADLSGCQKVPWVLLPVPDPLTPFFPPSTPVLPNSW